MAGRVTAAGNRERSIGFGIERLGLVALEAPRLSLALVALLTLGAVVGAAHLSFADRPDALYAPVPALFDPETGPSTGPSGDPADFAVLLVDGPVTEPAGWRALEGLHGRLADALGAERVLSAVSVARLIDALGPPPAGPFATSPAEAVPPADAQGVRAHPLGTGLIAPGVATVLIAPDPALARLDAVRRIEAAAEAALGTAPETAPTLSGRLTGVSVARAALIERVAFEQPFLLGAGLAVGFVLGALLLGRLVDAVVVAVVPVLSVLWIHGAIGALGIDLTLRLNDLPLLVLALAFTSSLHLVQAARRDLSAAGGDPRAIGTTVRRIGPAVVLSMLTTAAAFASFLASGSAAVAEVGLAGAAAVLGVMATALFVQPLVLWTALRLGWRAEAPVRGRAVRAFEVLSLGLACRLDRRRGPVVVLALLATLVAGGAMAQLDIAHGAEEEIPVGSTLADGLDRAADRLGAAAAVVLPLPVSLAEDTAVTTATLSALRRAHEAAEAALPGARVLSAHSLLRWLAESGRGVGERTVRTATRVLPAAVATTLLGADGEARIVATAPGDAAAIREAADRLEAAAGRALGTDLTGRSQGLAVEAARRGEALVVRVALGLVIASAGAAALAAIAFRSVAMLWLTLLPNLVPVLAVGAGLAALGAPLTLAPAMALTVALGIAVDATVHVASAFRRQRAGRRPPRAALARALRETTPVLATTTLVLGLGLAPALWSVSPAIAAFAGVAIATLVLALLADLVVLPALLALGTRLRAC